MLHPTTFEYIKPNPVGLALMQSVRRATSEYVKALEEYLPDGPDKTYLIRKAREVGMWANVAITRTADGTPRPDYTEQPGTPAP
jgi:hypothetical protein